MLHLEQLWLQSSKLESLQLETYSTAVGVSAIQGWQQTRLWLDVFFNHQVQMTLVHPSDNLLTRHVKSRPYAAAST